MRRDLEGEMRSSLSLACINPHERLAEDPFFERALSGDCGSRYTLALRVARGRFISPRDPSWSMAYLSLLRAAALAGHPLAMRRLGVTPPEMARLGVEVRPLHACRPPAPEGFEQRAALSDSASVRASVFALVPGNPDEQYDEAHRWLQGSGGSSSSARRTDDERGFQFLHRAASNGHASAKRDLAELFGDRRYEGRNACTKRLRPAFSGRTVDEHLAALPDDVTRRAVTSMLRLGRSA